MITYDIMTTYSVMTTYDVMIMYSRLGVVYIGAGCAKLSGQGNVWPTTGSDELYCACRSKKVYFTKGCHWTHPSGSSITYSCWLKAVFDCLSETTATLLVKS